MRKNMATKTLKALFLLAAILPYCSLSNQGYAMEKDEGPSQPTIQPASTPSLPEPHPSILQFFEVAKSLFGCSSESALRNWQTYLKNAPKEMGKIGAYGELSQLYQQVNLPELAKKYRQLHEHSLNGLEPRVQNLSQPEQALYWYYIGKQAHLEVQQTKAINAHMNSLILNLPDLFALQASFECIDDVKQVSSLERVEEFTWNLLTKTLERMPAFLETFANDEHKETKVAQLTEVSKRLSDLYIAYKAFPEFIDHYKKHKSILANMPYFKEMYTFAKLQRDAPVTPFSQILSQFAQDYTIPRAACVREYLSNQNISQMDRLQAEFSLAADSLASQLKKLNETWTKHSPCLTSYLLEKSARDQEIIIAKRDELLKVATGTSSEAEANYFAGRNTSNLFLSISRPQHTQRKLVTESITYLEKALSLHGEKGQSILPDFMEASALSLLGSCYLVNNNIPEAYKQLKRCLQLENASGQKIRTGHSKVSTLYSFLQACYILNKYQQVIKTCDEIISLDLKFPLLSSSDLIKIHGMAGKSALERGDMMGGINYLHKAMNYTESLPNSESNKIVIAETLLSLARAYHKKHKADYIRRSFEDRVKSSQLYLQASKLYKNLSKSASSRERYSFEYLKTFSKALRLRSGDCAEYHLTALYRFLKMNQETFNKELWEDCQKLLTAARKLEPQPEWLNVLLAKTLNSIAYYHHLRRDYDTSGHFFDQAADFINNDPKKESERFDEIRAITYWGLGIGYKYKGNLQEAKKYLELAEGMCKKHKDSISSNRINDYPYVVFDVIPSELYRVKVLIKENASSPTQPITTRSPVSQPVSGIRTGSPILSTLPLSQQRSSHIVLSPPAKAATATSARPVFSTTGSLTQSLGAVVVSLPTSTVTQPVRSVMTPPTGGTPPKTPPAILLQQALMQNTSVKGNLPSAPPPLSPALSAVRSSLSGRNQELNNSQSFSSPDSDQGNKAKQITEKEEMAQTLTTLRKKRPSTAPTDAVPSKKRQKVSKEKTKGTTGQIKRKTKSPNTATNSRNKGKERLTKKAREEKS
jgi:hypothetical protein